MFDLEYKDRLVRYGDLIPCKTAFIDAHTPGSNKKENFTIIGAGVSENPDQHIHISIPHGFNIGAAGQPPNCCNSLHSHKTAEVFIVLFGRWRFFWGINGDAGEVILEKGDIFNIPTGIFRGFENIGHSYGMLMAILGGDDAGGGVIWAPQVLLNAKKHGLILSETGKIYDTKIGQTLPKNEKMMPILSKNQLSIYPELKTTDVTPYYVARYLDLYSLSKSGIVSVIGKNGVIIDKPGFEVKFISEACSHNSNKLYNKDTVLMPVEGCWKFKVDTFELILNPGDTLSVPKNTKFKLVCTKPYLSSIYHIIPTNDPAGPTLKRKHK